MTKQETGAIIVRVVLGLIFFIHGLDKFQAGIGGTVGFFESVGVPGFLAYIVAVIELVGGLLMIIGLATRVVAILFAVVMVGAMFTVKFSAGFLDGYELDLALLAMSIYVVLEGKMPLAVDNSISQSNKAA